MSSTPGIRLTLKSSGVNASVTEYVWNASYGRFLMWAPPDYTVRLLGNEVINRGETLYWTFSEMPESAKDPVLITVTSRDPLTGNVSGSAMLILEWDGDTAVIARNNR